MHLHVLWTVALAVTSIPSAGLSEAVRSVFIWEFPQGLSVVLMELCFMSPSPGREAGRGEEDQEGGQTVSVC